MGGFNFCRELRIHLTVIPDFNNTITLRVYKDFFGKGRYLSYDSFPYAFLRPKFLDHNFGIISRKIINCCASFINFKSLVRLLKLIIICLWCLRFVLIRRCCIKKQYH